MTTHKKFPTDKEIIIVLYNDWRKLIIYKIISKESEAIYGTIKSNQFKS